MKHSHEKTSDRRRFLASLGGAAIAVPFAGALAQDPQTKPASKPARDDEPQDEAAVPAGIDVAVIAAGKSWHRSSSHKRSASRSSA